MVAKPCQIPTMGNQKTVDLSNILWKYLWSVSTFFNSVQLVLILQNSSQEK